MKSVFSLLIGCTTALSCFWSGAIARPAAVRPPNVVIVFADDLGYADVGPFGAEGYTTPHLDRMAEEGRVFTDFYAAQAVCSASRAALLTGCYPNRVGIMGALGPDSKIGINADETLLSEVFKSRGYATAIYGKWHLGHSPQFLPTRHGFDDYFGLPYSNDMWPQHPTNAKAYPPLPLIEGDKVVATNPDQTQLTTWYTERAVRFIDQHADEPFFLYVAHSMPHVPLFVSDKFEGKTSRGLFGDVISEIDWSVGQILDCLERNGLDDKTLIIFTSDNGPWLSYGDHAGSAKPLREGKGTSFEGGVREPFIARWKGTIPAGSQCIEPVMTIDILPTMASLIGAELEPDHFIDGRDILPLIEGDETASSPHEALLFYWGKDLQAIRSGPWKLHFPHGYRSLAEPGSGGKPGRYVEKQIGLELFNLRDDIGERTNVADQHPDIVTRLQNLAEKARNDLGDGATNRQGTNLRQPGRLTSVAAPSP